MTRVRAGTSLVRAVPLVRAGFGIQPGMGNPGICDPRTGVAITDRKTAPGAQIANLAPTEKLFPVSNSLSPLSRFRPFALSRLSSLLIAVALSLPGVCQERDAAGLAVVSKAVTSAEAVDIALRNNPTIAASRSAVAVFAARANMAGSMTKLQLATTTYLTKASDDMILAGSPGVEPANITMAPGAARASQNFMLMYPLFTGGKLRSTELAARSETGSASAEAAMAELDVALAAKIAYDQALLARSYVEAYKRRVDEASERSRIAEEAYKEGRIAQYDLLRNRTELADAQQQLTNAERDMQIADAELKRVLGISQDSVLTLPDKLECRPVEGQPADLQKEALARRPELAAARSMIDATEARRRAAKGSYLPQVYAVAMQDLGAVKDAMFASGSLVGVTASLPIVDGGLRKSAVDEAQAEIDRARSRERDAVLTVSRDVTTAWSELTAASKNVSLSQAAVEQSEEDYRVVKMRYEAGKSINVEVLDALAALVRAKTNYADALYQHSVARGKLARAIGRR